MQNFNTALRVLKPEWQTWESFAVNFTGVPDEANARVLWTAFRSQGNIHSIDLYENYAGKRNGRGRIRFKYVSF